MNDTPNTEITLVTEPAVAAPAVYFNETTGRFEDSEGNPVEVTTEEIGTVTTEGSVGFADPTAADVTLH